ncbi:peptidase S1 [Nocardia sp. SYP-A9097]|uniref:peptidase S1 n=1 Tax=Nocardia sp. SYP-A9097 TaxID=2663237 RepID=UPI00129BDB33|nr:peptidase S1 [Nocardia sp. SYP-A9097]MRH90502.1 peptidase S1 [Nocardia sp. SYP-A9097]
MSRNRLRAMLFTAVLTLTGTAAATADTPPARERAQVGGGSGLAMLRGGPLTDHSIVYLCTLTAIGYDAAGNLIGLTNAHCEYDGDRQWLGDLVLLESEAFAPGATVPDLHLLGRIEYISGGNPVVPGPNGPGLDYAVIVFDKSAVEPVATVGETTIRALGDPPPNGTPVCKQGATSARTCGVTLATAGPYLLTTVPEYPGDSGAPVVMGDTLIGNQWSWGAGTSMTAILADLDRRGGVGAGFHL